MSIVPRVTNINFLLTLPMHHQDKRLWLRPCLHYAELCCFTKKVCQPEAICHANNFFHQPKFSQVSPNFKDAVEMIWGAYNVLSGDKLLVPCRLSFVGSYHFLKHDQLLKYLYLTFLVICMSQRQTRLQKWKIRDYKINFVEMPHSIFCHCANRVLTNKNALIFQIILSTNSLRKCLAICLEEWCLWIYWGFKN